MITVLKFKNNSKNKYVLQFENDIAYVRAGTSSFMATLEYAASNGLLHSIICGIFSDHKIDYEAWCDINDYLGREIPTVEMWENIPHDYEINKCNFLRKYNG